MKVNVIPLAGKGKRFAEDGYTLPKPLIPVDGIPMVIAAAKSLPRADKYVFICLKEHLRKYHIARIIKKYFPESVIVSVDGVTAGQASTSLLAEAYVHPEAELTIGACDNGMVYHKSAYDKVMKDPKTDAVIWTFRNNPNVTRHPQHWGWVVVDKQNSVKKVSVKVPVSDTPMENYAIVGTFSFKKAKYFFDNVKKMIEANRRVNNEFYNDECMNVLIENGFKVKVFEIDTYIGWGTPYDLKIYEYWKGYFNRK